MKAGRRGFTIVEVLIAIIMLSIGVLALASSAGGITRMLSNGQRKTRSYAMASSLVDSLRRIAKSNCAGLPTSGSGTRSGISISWSFPGGVGSTNTTKQVKVIMSYRVGPFAKGDTLVANLYC
jgi:prepilin-type N-terminal cleavage/methylation domain-containing protein